MPVPVPGQTLLRTKITITLTAISNHGNQEYISGSEKGNLSSTLGTAGKEVVFGKPVVFFLKYIYKIELINSKLLEIECAPRSNWNPATCAPSAHVTYKIESKQRPFLKIGNLNHHLLVGSPFHSSRE